jgi:hypothetical protein
MDLFTNPVSWLDVKNKSPEVNTRPVGGFEILSSDEDFWNR